MPQKANDKPSVFVLIGPTATGKTAISIELARSFGAEIISCDSRQIYKHMDIGTAKPTAEELAQAPHHLIDLITPDRFFSYADFAAEAEKKLDEITARGKMAFIVGGTGFYLDGLINGVSEIPEMDQEKTENLRLELEMMDSAELVTILRKIDMTSAGRIKPNDRQRLIRAIIVSRLSGKPFSHFKDIKKKSEKYKYLIFGLTKPRELLYNNIGLRVDIMFKKGLLDEVRGLVKMGYTGLMPGMKTIGYQECVDHIEKGLPLAEVVELIKQHTRNYAKRQETYFKKIDVSNWYVRDGEPETDGKIYDSLKQNIEKNFKECQ
ncbi:MAG TPA: tRNA (adenosine(37)-N6)-dimethylallyltransferase MiaA [Candidatus Wallbacteria bacterium]|nr:tRNA (adenosine(37)-N6)-dimethylallyltransferase MiaA [Candidatus Wallbacteria bacterium]